MPIYEYQCKNCGQTLEKLQKISDAPLINCFYCGQPTLEKLVSSPSFRLKGKGWYETDFKTKSDSQKNLVSSEQPEKPKKKETVTESKSTESSS